MERRVRHVRHAVERVERRYKGGSSPPPPALPPQTYIDPVNGMVFMSPEDLNNEITSRRQYENAQQSAKDLQAKIDLANNPPPKPVQQVFTDPVTGHGYSSLDDLNAEIDTRTKQTADDKAAADKKTADDKAAALTDFNTRSTAARSNAETTIRNYFTNQGLDPNKYWTTDIAPALDREAQGIASLDPNPSSVYAPDLGAQIVADLTSGKRSQATNKISSEFGPTYVSDALPYTLDDSAINTILASQFDPLSAQLSNAQKRGTLSDTGYKAALDAMGVSQTGARSTVSALGTGIIDKDRSGLNDYITGAKNDASGLSLANADTFDPTAYLTGAQGRTKGYIDALPGDLTNAVGSTKFSDLTTLLNAGGSVQGGYDPTATNPNSTGATPSPQYLADQILANTKRGVGSTGAF